VQGLGNLVTSGLKVNKDGKLDWYMSSEEFGSWALCSAASVGAAYINTDLGVGKSVGDWAYNWTGGDKGGWLSVAMGYGIQKATEGFISGSLMSLAKSYNIATGQWNPYDWNNVLESTSVGLGAGFVSGWVGGRLGGTYSNGNLLFLDKNASKALSNSVFLFFAGDLNNFANTIGSIAGEGIHYAYGGNFRINLADGIGMGFTHDGQIVNDASGGVGLKNIVNAIGSLNYVSFQARNVDAGAEGWSRISYVNMGYLSGDRYAMRNSMDIINGRKDIVFDLTEDGHYGMADGSTIHLSKDAVNNNTAEGLAFYTSVVVREEYLGETAIENDNPFAAYIRELGASGIQTTVLMNISSNLGINLFNSDGEYGMMSKMLAIASAEGDLGDFSWESGVDLRRKYKTSDGKEIDIEYINQKFNKTFGKDGEGIERPLGGYMCNETSLAMAIVEMGVNTRNAYRKADGSKFSVKDGKFIDGANDQNITDADILELYRLDRYPNEYRGAFATLYKIALKSGMVEKANNMDKGYEKWYYDKTDKKQMWKAEEKYSLNKVINSIDGIYSASDKGLDRIAKHFLALKSYMDPNDKIIIGGGFKRIKPDGSLYEFGHIVKLLEIRNDGIVIQDPFGEYSKPDADPASYKINPSGKEDAGMGVYFLNWEGVRNIHLGKAYLYLKEYSWWEKVTRWFKGKK